jgi:hypothetical protein
MHHASIRPLLVDKPFQKMGQDGGCDYAQHQVIGSPRRRSSPAREASQRPAAIT